jgi:hypothetical protein
VRFGTLWFVSEIRTRTQTRRSTQTKKSHVFPTSKKANRGKGEKPVRGLCRANLAAPVLLRVPAAAPGNGTVFAEPPRDSRRPVSIAVMSSSEQDKFSQVGDIFGEMDRRGSALRPSSAAAG